MPKNILEYLHFHQPTEDQKRVLNALVQFVSKEDPYDFFVLCGSAGTGKTSITSALIGYMNDIEMPYFITAPTGRAARILGKKADVLASTVHSLIYHPVTDDKGVVHFTLRTNVDDIPSLYIIDEASMIAKNTDSGMDNSLFRTQEGLLYELIDYIKKSNVNNKILFLGDRYQLPPVQEKESYALNQDFLEQTFNLKGISHLLTEVKRQEDGSYIIQNATEIKNAIDQQLQQSPILGKKAPNIYKGAEDYTKDLKANGFENQVAISVSHKANKFFNDLVRDKIFGRSKEILEKHDLLMVVSNWNRDGQHLYNGDHVELIDVDWGTKETVAGLHFVPVKVKLLFKKEETIIDDYAILECLVNPGGVLLPTQEKLLISERLRKNGRYAESKHPRNDRYVGALRLTYGHAITCNKAQGGEWKKVFINTFGIPSLKWQYTAVTRAIDEIETF